MNYSLIIRPKRQTTFPNELLQKYDIGVGDSLVATDTGEGILLKPKKKIFLNALDEIQKIVKDSGILEEEMQRAAKEDRQNWAKSYGSKNVS